MDIIIEWQEPILLAKNKQLEFGPDNIPEGVEDIPGVYFFSRWHGELIEPFYIGRTLTLRQRLKTHLGTTKIVDVLERRDSSSFQVKSGARYFHYGYLRPRGPQRADQCIAIVEKYMIREAVKHGIPLINLKLMRRQIDNIKFQGNNQTLALFPLPINVPRD